MGNRNLLSGAATVEVDMWRYDDLLHKEARLEIVENMLSNGSNITFDTYQDIFGLRESENG